VIKETDLKLAEGSGLAPFGADGLDWFAGMTATGRRRYGQVPVPVLVLHGGQDRMVPSGHGAWLAARCPDAELWLRPDDGHVSVLGSCGVAALDWLVAHA
jgi:pimeloyl-ACP methyl ester carboxylesterase